MVSLTEPPGSSPLLAAALWTQNLATGPVASVTAVIAVAAVGLMMLGGRLNLRRGAFVLIGCFILFGASSIANGIRGAAIAGGLGSAEPVPGMRADDKPVSPMALPNPSPTTPYDPYAGASLPPR